MSKIKKINRNSSNNQEPIKRESIVDEVPITPPVENGTTNLADLERDFPTMTVEEPEIEPEEDTMDDVNRRLSDAILSLLDDERTLFKVTDLFYYFKGKKCDLFE